MQQKKRYLVTGLVFAITLGLIGFGNVILAAWNEPPVGTVPPNNNVNSPLNTGTNFSGDVLGTYNSLKIKPCTNNQVLKYDLPTSRWICMDFSVATPNLLNVLNAGADASIYAGATKGNVKIGDSGTDVYAGRNLYATGEMKSGWIHATAGGAGDNNSIMGNLGVGTVSPSQKFEVVGNVWLNNGSGVGGKIGLGQYANFNMTIADAGIMFGQSNSIQGANSAGSGDPLWFSSNAYKKQGAGWVYSGTAAASQMLLSWGQIDFYTANSGVAGNAIIWNNRLTIANTGNVGIGIASPGQKLDVNGAIRLEGNWGGLISTGGRMKIGTQGVQSVINGAFFDEDNNGMSLTLYGNSNGGNIKLKSGTGGIHFYNSFNPQVLSATFDFDQTNFSMDKGLNVGGNVGISGGLWLNNNLYFSAPGYHYIKHDGGSSDSDRFIFRNSLNQDTMSITGSGVLMGTGSSAATALKLKVIGGVGADKYCDENGTGCKTIAQVGGSSQWQDGTGAIYYNGGNVGIGTASPTQKLDVAGNISLGSNKLVLSNSGRVMFNGASDYNWQFKTDSNWNYVWTGAGNGSRSWILGNKTNNTDDGTYTSRFQVNMASGNTYLAPNGGNVGIGTASPLYALHVYNSTAEPIVSILDSAGPWSVQAIRVNGNNNQAIGLGNFNGIATYKGSLDGNMSNNPISHDFKVYDHDYLNTAPCSGPNYSQACIVGSERDALTIDDKGNVNALAGELNTKWIHATVAGDNTFKGDVSIGTTTPATSSTANTRLVIQATGQTSSDVVRGLDMGGGIAWQISNTTGTGPNPVYTYFNKGNVGIGTATPNYKLDVDGSVHATSYYSSDNTAGLTSTINVRKADNSGSCAITVKNGLITETTCP